MANGIKLRRGLKAALTTTIAEGEFVLCTDTGELGFKKGASEVDIDLDKVATDIDELQDEISAITSNQEVLLPRQFKVSINKFYDFDLNPQTKPSNNGGFRIPIAKVNPLYIGNEFALQQVTSFSNVSITKYDFDSYGNFNLSNLYTDYMLINTRSDLSGGFTLQDEGSNNFRGLSLDILDDGYGNFNVWLKIGIDGSEYITHKVIIAFDMYCVSEVGKDLNNAYYNVFLPPLDLEITPYNGAP